MAINIKPSRRGKLHRALGVPQGQPIPAAKLAKASKTKSPALKKEVVFAENAKHFDHSGGHPHKNLGKFLHPKKKGRFNAENVVRRKDMA